MPQDDEQPAPTVLIVDDEPGIRRALRRILRTNGYRCLEAGSAREARDIIATSTVDAALCDIALGGEDGWSLVKWIRRLELDLAVLVITGSTAPDALGPSHNHIDGFILKPFEASEIVINLANALARRTDQHAAVNNLQGELTATARALDEASLELDTAHDALERHNRIWETLVSSAGMGVMLLDGRHRLDFANPRACELLGFCGQPVASRTPWSWLDVFVEDDRAAVRQAVTAATSTSLQVRAATAGDDLHLVLRAAPITTSTSECGGVVVSIDDITDLVNVQHQFEMHQTIDEATGLPNRASLLTQLRTRLDQAGPNGLTVGVVNLNLAALRHLATLEGEDAYDAAFTHIANRVRSVCGSSEIVGRSGPTTLSIVTISTSRSDAVSVLPSRIARSLAAPVPIGETTFAVVPRLGVALADSGSTAESLLRDAALASEDSEADGGLRVFNESMRAEARRRLTIESGLRVAIDRQEIEVHYQPIVSCDRRLAGFEALARWTHPELGSVPPSVFIPLAEELGVIGPLGDVILTRVARQLRTWQDRGAEAEFWVSVNMAPDQLADDGMARRISELLRSNSVSPERLCVEVTERTLADAADAGATLHQLRQLGVLTALDDFGTGFSSLDALVRLEFDIVKVAGALVPPKSGFAEAHSSAQVLLQSLVDAAHTLGLTVVVEAVESERQWDDVRLCDVDLVQGWAFAAAAPPDDPLIVNLVHGQGVRTSAPLTMR